MIPSRGIARSIPSGIRGGVLAGRLPSRTLATRSLHSSRRATRHTGLVSSHGARVTLFGGGTSAAPIAPGSVASSRHLSLWGWGSSSSKSTTTTTAIDEAEKATQAAQGQQQQAASSATDAAADNVSAASASPLTEPPVGATEIDTSGIMSMLTGQDILGLPADQIGYLESLGLVHGWPGFSWSMQWLLEHLHVWYGLGWGASIIATAFALRGVMTLPQVMAQRSGARMARMQADPRSKEMMRLGKLGFTAGDREATQQSAYLRKMLKQEYKINNASFLWSFMQIPFTFGLFNVIRQMSAIPVPGLESGGFLWFTDLTVRDPYFVLPAVATGLMITSMIINRKYMAQAQAKMMQPMLWGIGGIGFAVTTFLSAGINLMGVAFGASTLLMTVFFEIPALRRRLGLAMGPPAAPASQNSISTTYKYEAPRGGAAAGDAGAAGEAPAAPQGIRERLSSSLNDARQGMSQQLGNMGGRYGGTDAERAERKRKDLMKKLEDTRKEQEREQFEKKYKKKN